VKIKDIDIIYLSYDEPNAEENYADLLTKAPWAKHVHGVEGSDAAHKACARLSETSRFITVDADNKIYADFLEQEIDFKQYPYMKNAVLSWCGYNVVNGLMYGNGGLKCWPKDIVLDMKTHEASESEDIASQVEFCWNLDYIQMNSCYSKVYNNASAKQAWRAGFREGVKMSLDRGTKFSSITFSEEAYWQNLHRLMIWQMVGADITNGIWAMYGARQGCYMTNLTDWDYVQVRDFAYLETLWEDVKKQITPDNILSECTRLGKLLHQTLQLPVDQVLSVNQSKMFKYSYTNTDRTGQGFIDIE
jgi:hypothetical protein|tara:strand:- start:2890 stop:3801 length:912 start_codon:yes stop_codon:yes gene_type:complete